MGGIELRTNEVNSVQKEVTGLLHMQIRPEVGGEKRQSSGLSKETQCERTHHSVPKKLYTRA